MNRRELREHIFRLLFQAEFHDKEEMPVQGQLYAGHLAQPDGPDAAYIIEKTMRIVQMKEDLDQRIDAVAVGWKTSRMGRVDLTIIRLALYEMSFDEDVPVGVAINEAVELAKRYGTDDSPSFVNGILARLV